MSQNEDDFDPASLDINDLEIQPLLAAHAAVRGISLAKLKSVLQRVIDLPNELGKHPIERLDNCRQFLNQLPMQRLQVAYRRAVKEHPHKADMTFVEFVKEIMLLGAQKVQEEEEGNRKRLEKLLND